MHLNMTCIARQWWLSIFDTNYRLVFFYYYVKPNRGACGSVTPACDNILYAHILTTYIYTYIYDTTRMSVYKTHLSIYVHIHIRNLLPEVPRAADPVSGRRASRNTRGGGSWGGVPGGGPAGESRGGEGGAPGGRCLRVAVDGALRIRVGSEGSQGGACASP